MSLIIVKKTKDLFKTHGLKTSDEAIRALNEEFKKICEKTASTVLANKLKTVKGAHVPKMPQGSSS